MFGRIRWKLLILSLIIIVSLTHAIEQPTKSLIDPELPSFTNDKLGITIENLSSNSQQQHASSRRRQLRNLIPPYQEFSSIDEVQFIDSKTRNSRNFPGTFGSFRYSENPQKSSSPSPFRRRSDEYDDSIGTYPASQIAYDLNYDFDYFGGGNDSEAVIATTISPVTTTTVENNNRFRHKIIPISLQHEIIALADELENEEARNNNTVAVTNEEINDDEKKNDEDDASESSADKVRFPDDNQQQKQPRSEALTARRSGIQFTENESNFHRQQQQQLLPQPQVYNPFIPQSYSEESLNFGDGISNLQRPYHSEENESIDVENENERSGNGNRYYRQFMPAPAFRDEVTKFGDSNGPVTAFNRQHRDFNDQVVFFPRTQYESTGSGTFYNEPENIRASRAHFFPPKVFTEYPDYTSSSSTPQINSKYYQQPATQTQTYTWKTRQPRVVFPPPEFGPGTTYVGNDNVVFRDQNFGINDLAAIQDVRNEFEIDESTPVAKDKAGIEVFGRTPRSEMECQHEGGTCEFFVMCWMTGGLLQGTCNGMLQGCCHRTAKSSNLGPEAGKTFDLTDLPNTDYGPVVNDNSCGISLAKQVAQRRIVGGDDAGFGNFPWQAYIRIGSSRCGGSLVSRRHVVTAGHCVARAIPRQVHVTLGDYVINSAVEPLPAYTFGVRQINVHPYFKFTPQADRFDVAVLTLERPVHYMPHIAPICLPEKNEEFLGKYGWAAGWGALSPGSRLRPKTLQAVDVPVIDNRVCERWHRSNGINVVIYPEMLCAGYRNGRKDSCQGDSGGPLMNEKNGRWYLIGIVSAGYSCASKGQPGIYHRVPHTVDWISHIINSATTT
ncbi:hypothetical protein PVAND_009841 [Polypedilum vanderplanki]|uniref:Peptidase S1 domain-containing protein n=1 Tax=Polypedilum vanderplanki TaxID=319348 RepID=A0A9J6CDS5_POLVA|nr:hypothetical protein PVAND_009841 [Polypedilum vanderplanki]